MITFLLVWCSMSLVGTAVALWLIRSGKKRQPEPDDYAPTARPSSPVKR